MNNVVYVVPTLIYLTLYLAYFTIRVKFRLANSFGHGLGFGFGILVVPYIFTFALGYGNSEYLGSFCELKN